MAAPAGQTHALERRGPTTNPSRLFTAEELAVLPEGLLDRQKQKQLAKKAKKKRAAAERTEGELMASFIGMDVDEAAAGADMGIEEPRLSKRQMKKQRLRDQMGKKRAAMIARPAAQPIDVEVDMEAKKEADFANFLAQVGGDDMDEEL